MRITRRRLATAIIQGAAVISFPAVVRPQSEPTKLVMGSPMPSRHSASTFVAQAIESIRLETHGAIDILFLPDSQLGSEADMQRQLRSGGIQLLVASCSSLQSLSQIAGLPGLAYAFKTYDGVWSALAGELGQLIKASLQQLNMTTFKCLDNGFRNISTGTVPINAVSDLAGLKIRVPPSPLLTSLFKSLGASPTTISIGELYSALQTKVADGMENSLVQFEALKIFEVQKHCCLTAHSWDGLWIMANSTAWQGLPSEFRTIIERTFNDAVEKQHQDFAKQDIELKATLEAKGMTFTRPDRSSFVKALLQDGYYTQWRQRFGQEAWSALERYTGPLGG
jgi:tripartite ATP-independent transporter DctP family solute receptor